MKIEDLQPSDQRPVASPQAILEHSRPGYGYVDRLQRYTQLPQALLDQRYVSLGLHPDTYAVSHFVDVGEDDPWNARDNVPYAVIPLLELGEVVLGGKEFDLRRRQVSSRLEETGHGPAQGGARLGVRARTLEEDLDRLSVRSDAHTGEPRHLQSHLRVDVIDSLVDGHGLRSARARHPREPRADPQHQYGKQA